MGELFDDAVAAFKVRLTAAVTEMRAAKDPESFTEAERTVHGLAQGLAASITKAVLQEVSNDGERSEEALSRVRDRAGTKGIQVRVERRRSTKIRTLGGQVVDVVTPYATARPRGDGTRATRGAQGTGVYPVLDQLGILGRSTPALRLLVSRMVCEANSVTSARELLSTHGVEMDHKAALRLTYLTTDAALLARTQAMRATTEGNDAGEFAGRRVVAAVDGGRVNIRRRVAGRPKKGGRKHFVTEWREPKILTLYVIDDNGKRDRTVAPVIDGTLGDADAVFDLVRYHLLRMGAHLATELVVLGDGAKWIWNRVETLRQELKLPVERVTQIVDYYHVIERLTELARSRSRWSEERRAAWVSDQKEHLCEGRVEAVEASIKKLLKGKKKALKTEMDYWERNRKRVDYSAFREADHPIGSGAVESSVRRVINLRLKGASITWIAQHAEGVIHLRAYAKSGRWSELEEAVLARTGWRPTARRIVKAA